jgi:hypothetical protein
MRFAVTAELGLERKAAIRSVGTMAENFVDEEEIIRDIDENIDENIDFTIRIEAPGNNGIATSLRSSGLISLGSGQMRSGLYARPESA